MQTLGESACCSSRSVCPTAAATGHALLLQGVMIGIMAVPPQWRPRISVISHHDQVTGHTVKRHAGPACAKRRDASVEGRLRVWQCLPFYSLGQQQNKRRKLLMVCR